MILFVAPNPHKVKEREGFLQRVAAIDEIFSEEEKLYSEDLPTKKDLAEALVRADVVYVHSMYNANRILKCYKEFSHKIITDLHGVVPEEEEYADNQEMARVMTATEKVVFKEGIYFVAVTKAMVEHFKNKYPAANNRWVVLPVYMGQAPNMNDIRLEKQRNKVIYAGGGQRWQNVELMVDAINKATDKYSFTVLTHTPEAFSGVDDKNFTKVVIKTVPSAEVANYYKKASLGFVLRKDTIVNNVACPTKLIEYLSYGVVPIVLSENIGDFKTLGYRYISLVNFLEGKITQEFIDKAAERNHQVYKEFLTLIEAGKKDLIQMRESIKAARINNEAGYQLFIEEKLASQETLNEVLRYEYQVEAYRKKIGEYADLAEHYKQMHEKTNHRPRRQFTKPLRKINEKFRRK